MRLTIIGSTGSMAGPDSPASSYLVSAEDANGRTWNLVLDLGSGAFGVLQTVVDPGRIDGVAITHLHPDHYVDLCGLYVYRRYHPRVGSVVNPQMASLGVRAPAGAEHLVGRTFGLQGDEKLCAFNFSEWTGDGANVWHVGPLRVEAFVVDHPVEAYALRVTGPSSVEPGTQVTLTYSGDTDDCDNLVTAALDSDMFLVEAAFLEGRDIVRGVHLTGVRAGQVATRARAKRVLLTHLQPWTAPEAITAEVATTYAGPAEVVRPRAVYSL